MSVDIEIVISKLQGQQYRYSNAKLAYKSVAFRSAGELVGDDDGLEDLSVLVKMLSKSILLRLPRKTSHKHLGECLVAKLLVHLNLELGDEEVVNGSKTENKTIFNRSTEEEEERENLVASLLGMRDGYIYTRKQREGRIRALDVLFVYVIITMRSTGLNTRVRGWTAKLWLFFPPQRACLVIAMLAHYINVLF